MLAARSLPLPCGSGSRESSSSGIIFDSKFRPKVKVRLYATGYMHKITTYNGETVAPRTEHPNSGRKAERMEFFGMVSGIEELSFVR